MGGVPSVNKRPPTAKRTPAPKTNKKTAAGMDSPAKSQAPITSRTAAVE